MRSINACTVSLKTSLEKVYPNLHIPYYCEIVLIIDLLNIYKSSQLLRAKSDTPPLTGRQVTC